jgi:hypothetical protein
MGAEQSLERLAIAGNRRFDQPSIRIVGHRRGP